MAERLAPAAAPGSPGSPASPAAAKRAAIIDRYGLNRAPPIPVPVIESPQPNGLAKVCDCSWEPGS